MQVFILSQKLEVEGNQVVDAFHTKDDALAYRDMMVREYFEFEFDEDNNSVAWPTVCEYIADFSIFETEVMKVLHKE